LQSFAKTHDKKIYFGQVQSFAKTRDKKNYFGQVQSFAKTRGMNGAQAIMNMMHFSGINPDLECYTSLIEAYGIVLTQRHKMACE
jgi:hypothetical protein